MSLGIVLGIGFRICKLDLMYSLWAPLFTFMSLGIVIGIGFWICNLYCSNSFLLPLMTSLSFSVFFPDFPLLRTFLSMLRIIVIIRIVASFFPSTIVISWQERFIVHITLVYPCVMITSGVQFQANSSTKGLFSDCGMFVFVTQSRIVDLLFLGTVTLSYEALGIFK